MFPLYRAAPALLLLASSYVYAKENVDLIVSHGTVVTMDPQRRLLDDSAVAVTGELIVAIGSSERIAAGFDARKTIDARGALIMPGLINAHTHMAMSMFRGLAEDRSLQEWLQKFIFPAEARNVTPDFVTWSTKLSLLEMIRGGTTTAADMYYFEEEVAQALKDAGMRGCWERLSSVSLRRTIKRQKRRSLTRRNF